VDYNVLLDLTVELGYRLAMSGAETFRIEESINRIMDAYGIRAEAFAIPNCLHVSIETADGIPMTRMRRIGQHGNDLDAVEKFSNLSRKICSQRPDPKIAMDWLNEVEQSRLQYKLPVYLIGNFLGACGFSILFGGNFIDSLCAGLCGIAVGLVNRFMDNLKANPFFRTIAAAFLMALVAYFTGYLALAKNIDAVIIGALMILVPGLIFTNAMRDIIYGDTNSGINRIVQVFLIAAAIALGTGAAWKFAGLLWGIPVSAPSTIHRLWVEAIACFVGCIGFSILFNIHGPGGLLCALGGMLTWLTYRLCLQMIGDDIASYFFATMVASLYSEIMARIRKYPAISYLVVSAFPLIPGAGVYYTMNYAVRSDMEHFASQGMHTVAIAGVMAVGILLVSTIVRLINLWLIRRKKIV
jgi:uncharacterized membrane protein YjjP (DUF1212 family)